MPPQAIPEFYKVTDSPLNRATNDQLATLYTRYELAVKYAEGKDVLEVACGAGVGLGRIAQVARRVVGGDIDERNCAIASETYKGRPEVEMRQLDAERIPYPSCSFDLVILYEALYYLNSADAFFREAKRLLRPRGVLLISSVNHRWSGFNPSPFSTRYYDAAELAEALKSLGFGVSMYGGFPENTSGVIHKAIGAFRKAAVRLHLIPNTQKSKEWLKRIFYGKLQPIPRELPPAVTAPAALDALAPPYASDSYRFIYCAARLEMEQKEAMAHMPIGESARAVKQDPAGVFLAFKRKAGELELGDISMPAGLQAHIWRPRLLHPFPPYPAYKLGEEKMLGFPALLFFYLYAMKRGARSAYRIAVATDESQSIRGFAVLRGGDIRFPFMASHDVQFGPVWTAADYRGHGLASKLCRLALRELTGPACDVWWLCKGDNQPSQAVAWGLGLQLASRMLRRTPFGLPAPHFYTAYPGETPRQKG